MLIEETICIRAPLSKVWELFIDLSCWADWNTILVNTSIDERKISAGKILKCSIKPYTFPINFNIKVIEFIPKKKIIWKGEKYGITSFHEFLFEELPQGVTVKSRERFSGLPLIIFSAIFPKEKIRSLNKKFLLDLKNASEAINDRKD